MGRLIMSSWAAPRLRLYFPTTVLCLLLVACSAGDVFVAGIEGTGIVSGFGSVYINGREFATDDTRFFRNGQPSNEDAFHVGDVVMVMGTVDADGRAVARRIEFNRMLDGPIQSLDVHNGVGRLTTLGQTVLIDGSTKFINTSTAELSLGDLIAVSGQFDADGALRATSLEESAVRYSFARGIEVEGLVSDLDLEARQFRLGGLDVDFGNAATVDESDGALADGAFVDVVGTQSGAGAVLQAQVVRVRARGVGESGGRVELDALITDFNGTDDFRLDGQLVDATGARRLDQSGLSLADGVRVQVDGVLRSGVLVVEALSVRPPPDITFVAKVDAVSADRFVLFGQTAQVQPTTLYRDANLRTFRIGDLQAGDAVFAQGYRNTDNQLVITSLERLTTPAAAQARGQVTDIDQAASTVQVGGVTVRTNNATQYVDAAGVNQQANSFFDALRPGDSVQVSGPEINNQIDPATRIQIISSAL